VLSPAKWCAGLLATDLVGELRLLVFPVLPGRGKRLFDDRSRIGIPARGIEGTAACWSIATSGKVRNG
jgi:hypothetical protein